LNIVSTQYTLKYGSYEIYVSGCHGKCVNCHNPELHDFNLGTPYKAWIPKIKGRLKSFSELIDWVWVLGGEPLMQDIEELIDLLKELKSLNKPIMLFTGFDYDYVPKEIIALCDYIKCGAYVEELRTDDNIQYGVPLASSSQKIYKLRG
jgi:anaerobic ribonucleoside-triphosphate reductase activating protein